MSEVQVVLTASGSGTVTIGGVATPLRGAGLEAAREVVRQLVARAAAEAGRAMVMDVAEPSGTWQVQVEPDGSVCAPTATTQGGGPSVARLPLVGQTGLTATVPTASTPDPAVVRVPGATGTSGTGSTGDSGITSDTSEAGDELGEPTRLGRSGGQEPAVTSALIARAPARGRGGWRTSLVVALVAAGGLLAAGGVAAGWAVASTGAGERHADPTATAEVVPAPHAVGVLRAGSASQVCQADPAGGVRCWGATADAQTVPVTEVSGVQGRVTALAVGRGFGVAVTSDGLVWAWGADDRGQLGVPEPPAGASTAVRVGRLPGPAEDLVAGTEHACALASGRVFCFGSSRVGQVAGQVTVEPVGLTEVEAVPGPVTALGTSGYDTWAVTEEGSVWAWGSNQWGQVDPSSPGVSSAPARVVSP